VLFLANVSPKLFTKLVKLLVGHATFLHLLAKGREELLDGWRPERLLEKPRGASRNIFAASLGALAKCLFSIWW
jgi:hypothetical protein